MTTRVVVIGNGMSGARLAEEIRSRDPAAQRVALTVLGAEPSPAYNRVLLSSVLAGALPRQLTELYPPGWAADRRVDIRIGVKVSNVDRTLGRVVFGDGSAVHYDRLVLATGSRAWVPPVEGVLDAGGALVPEVCTFRTMEDCARILDRARSGAPIAVLGGGVLGLEVACGLAGRGNRVTVVHPGPRLMERQLDTAAGRVLAGVLGRLGVRFRLGVRASAYLPGDGLKLADGGCVPAETLVITAGVRPETALAEAAGLAVDRGVLVDDRLATGDSRIHAIGDCARHPGAPAGLVAPAWEQAAVLADLLTGADPAARYRGSTMITRLKAAGVDLSALGEVHTEADEQDGAEVLRYEEPARGRYAKLVLRGGRVTGAITLGVPDAAARICGLYQRGAAAPEDRMALLLGRALSPADAGSPADLPASAVICRCNTVSKRQLVAAFRAGARGVAGLAAATRATTGCGGCRDAVRGIADWLDEADPQPVILTPTDP